MCGFVGIWEHASGQPVDSDLLERMTDVIEHRGPDDAALHVDHRHQVGLGFRRLSIIDLSLDGRQPMSNEDGSLWIVFNGEIYNYTELAGDLRRRHDFKSNTDSEVIVHAFEEHGIDCIHRLNGMFAIAIWHANRKRLILLRDRVGKKPLFYVDNGKRFLFASEMKSLVVDRSVPREIDPVALQQYLSLGYIPPPNTILKGIKKLPPGHFLVFENGQANVQRYWDWFSHLTPDETKSEEEWIDLLDSELTTAVKRRLVSDVPLGAFLSGGVDSSIVVAKMASLQSTVKTFSIGFEEEAYNEITFARQVAQKYGTDHHEMIVSPELLENVLPMLVRQFDEPFADSSAVPTYYVSKFAKEFVTVVLTGDGGDEVFGGYGRYLRAFRDRMFDWIPLIARKGLAAVVPHVFRNEGMVTRVARRMVFSEDQRYTRSIQLIPTPVMDAIIQQHIRLEWQESGLQFVDAAMAKAKPYDYLTRMQYTDAVSYLPEDILVKVDRTSMLNSLEARCPLLDHRLMELAGHIPHTLRVNNGVSKYILKRAMKQELPEEIVSRPKQGFGIPIRKWFRDDLFEFAADTLLGSTARDRGIFDIEAVGRILQRHEGGKTHSETTIWSLLFFENWCQAWLDVPAESLGRSNQVAPTLGKM